MSNERRTHLGRLCEALDDLADRLADDLADERAHADRLAELLALHGCEDPIVLDLLAAHQDRRGDA